MPANRRANTKQAAISERNATLKATVWRTACQLIAGMPAGAPGGKPRDGSGWKIPGATHRDCAGEDQQAGDFEVGDLDPAQVSEAQHADRLPREVEALAGEDLDQGRDDEQLAGDDAGGQHGSRQPRGRLRPNVGCPSSSGGDVLALHLLTLLSPWSFEMRSSSAGGQPILRSVTSIDGSQVTPSALRSWWAVWIRPSSLNVAVQSVISPCQVQTPARRVSSEAVSL